MTARLPRASGSASLARGVAVNFSISHELDMPIDAVELALMSPDLAAAFAERWEGVSGVERVSHEVDAARIERIWRCQAKSPLKVLKGYEITRDMLTWDEHWQYDRADHRGTWHVVPRPGVDPDAGWRARFEMRGEYLLDPLADGRARRTVRGDIRVELKVVGKVVERIAVAELRKAFSAEAEALGSLSTLP